MGLDTYLLGIKVTDSQKFLCPDSEISTTGPIFLGPIDTLGVYYALYCWVAHRAFNNRSWEIFTDCPLETNGSVDDLPFFPSYF